MNFVVYISRKFIFMTSMSRMSFQQFLAIEIIWKVAFVITYSKQPQELDSQQNQGCKLQKPLVTEKISMEGHLM